MQTLPQIQVKNDAQVVSAREVWQYLEVKRQFADWIKARIIKYQLREGKDFTTFSQNSEKGRPEKEYYLTLDTAKQLAMVENNYKGLDARLYFIRCEEALYAVGKVITKAQSQALGNQKAKFEVKQELKDFKKECAHVFKQQTALKKRLKALDNDTFDQLRLFEKSATVQTAFSIN